MNFRSTYPPVIRMNTGTLDLVERGEEAPGTTFLRIAGIASTAGFRGDGFNILPEAFAAAIPRFMEKPILAASHSLHVRDVIGRVDKVEMRSGNVYIEASVTGAETSLQQKLRERLVRSFSIGFNPLTGEVSKDGRSIDVTEVEWLETSIVALGRDYDATFDVRRETEFARAVYDIRTAPERREAELVCALAGATLLPSSNGLAAGTLLASAFSHARANGVN